MRTLLRAAAVVLALLLLGPAMVVSCGHVSLTGDWRSADRSSTGLAPLPAQTPDALVQVYAARAFRWRGIFGVHTWIATKRAGARRYVVHHVLGWRAYHGRPVVVSVRDAPDRSWFGSPPKLLAEVRGPRAAAAIPRIEAAVRAYPHAHDYRVWPGPNSNTFTAWVARRVPELELDLPPTAIGKDYLPNGSVLARAPSGTGWQASLLGVLGITAALDEGLELNLLGLGLGVDVREPALRLPGIGRIGVDDGP